MRILLALVILAGLGWSGYWFLGAQTAERQLTNWMEARAAEGWVVSHDGIDTQGFPNRFDTTITGLELADPRSGIAWQAPFLQIFALSYRPHHVIVQWPDRQTLATPLQTITMTSQGMRGSMVFAPGIALALDRATIEFGSTGLVSTLGWQASLDGGQLAVRRTPAQENTYDIAFEARDLLLPGRLTQMLGRAEGGAETLGNATLDATVAFDAPWDRYAIEQRRPQPRRIDVTLARASLGELDLRLAGELEVDGRGRPEGEITVKAQNWREILQLARAGGALPDGLYTMLEGGLGTVARMSGNPETLDMPLRFGDGRVSLAGLIPLGPAPILQLR